MVDLFGHELESRSVGSWEYWRPGLLRQLLRFGFVRRREGPGSTLFPLDGGYRSRGLEGAFRKGRQARLRGARRSENPYKLPRRGNARFMPGFRKAWLAGWRSVALDR